MCGVNSRALSAVGGDRVAKLDVLGDVAGRKRDGCSPSASAVAADGQVSVVVRVKDGPAVAVLDPSSAGGQAPVVAACDDRVALTGQGAVVEGDAARTDLPGEYPVGSCALVQRCDGVGGLRDQDARVAGGGVGLPGAVCGVEDLVAAAFDDPSVLVVEVDYLGRASAFLCKRFGLV